MGGFPARQRDSCADFLADFRSILASKKPESARSGTVHFVGNAFDVEQFFQRLDRRVGRCFVLTENEGGLFFVQVDDSAVFVSYDVHGGFLENGVNGSSNRRSQRAARGESGHDLCPLRHMTMSVIVRTYSYLRKPTLTKPACVTESNIA